MNRRVVVTGMAALCPIGNSWPEVRENLRAMKSGVATMESWPKIEGMRTRLGAPVRGLDDLEQRYPRKKVRTMGRVALLAAHATQLALEQAGLLDHPSLRSGATGISYGSTSGSPTEIQHFGEAINERKTLSGLTAGKYIKLMSHTCAANLAQFFEIQGRVLTTCSACTAGSQGIGYAYESIKFGMQDVMIAGGAEELHVFDAIVFDILLATSQRNQQPLTNPRPFDSDRDGLVVGEGAGTLILESLEHAHARGAKIYGEIEGFATNCDGEHMVHPAKEGMERVMRAALRDAGISADQIGYVNAHGTATEVGDIAESLATAACFGRAVPISSLKGYMGHTLGACGAIEAWIAFHVMAEEWLPPNLNLDQIDPRCAELDYIRQPREIRVDRIMSNNFAFGGVNTSLILKRWLP